MNERVERELLTKRHAIRGFDPKNAFKVLDAIREASAELEKKFPKEFVGLNLTGSRSKGYAENESDVDVGLICRADLKNNKEEICQIIEKALAKRGLYFTRKLFFHVFDKIFFKQTLKGLDARAAGDNIASLFGLVTGKKINELRLEVISHIEKKLSHANRKIVWWRASKAYSRRFLLPPKKEEVSRRLMEAGVTKQILAGRLRKFQLPPLEEMKKSLIQRQPQKKRLKI